MKLSEEFHAAGFSLPVIRRVPADRCFVWLRAGWRDLAANPLPSLAYGLLFALGGDLIILAALDTPYLVTVAVSGFFLVAPLLAAGLYELSRASARGERPMFLDSLRVFTRNTQSLAFFGLMLALAAILWERITAISFALFGGDAPISGGYLYSALVDGQHWPLLGAWLLVGATLALFVFMLAAISVPMMVDRDCDMVTAMASSLHAFANNPGALLLWAGMIVFLTLLGFATLLFGLIVTMPLIGHASWHAYRDLVAG